MSEKHLYVLVYESDGEPLIIFENKDEAMDDALECGAIVYEVRLAESNKTKEVK